MVVSNLILENYGLLKKYAGKYARGDEELMNDLIVFAMKAITRAEDSFDQSKGYTWSTYVGVCIQNACRTYMREKYVKYDFDNVDDIEEPIHTIDYTDEYLKDKILKYLTTVNTRRVESLLSMYTTNETMTDIAKRRGTCVNTVRNEAIKMMDELREFIL